MFHWPQRIPQTRASRSSSTSSAARRRSTTSSTPVRAGFSPGDLYVFSDRYFLAETPTVQVGRDDGRCVLIDPAALRFDCSITNSLSGNGGIQAGDVMASGTLTLAQGTTSHFAILGGTGVYATARGDASVVLGPLEGPHEVTVRLILNP